MKLLPLKYFPCMTSRSQQKSVPMLPHTNLGLFLQEHESECLPVTLASRALDTDSRYAPIENEALALTWACEKFSDYILGKHKPLVSILGQMRLDSLQPRICFMRFQYAIHFPPEQSLYLAYALSIAPLKVPRRERNRAGRGSCEVHGCLFLQASQQKKHV